MEPNRPARELDLPTVPASVPPVGFVESARGLGVEFDAGDVERLGVYVSLLIEAGRVMNLTAAKDADEVWSRHVLDALSLLGPMAEVDDGARVVDVGSGGGLPAMVLAVCRPGVRFTLVESTGKKAQFLRLAAERLGLGNVEVLAERAETLGRDRSRRESFDAATCRAVGHLAVVCELCGPLVRPGGLLFLVKGERAGQELAEAAVAMDTLGLDHVGTVPTPTGRVVVLERVGKVSRSYPRRPGEPARAPIGLRGVRKREERDQPPATSHQGEEGDGGVGDDGAGR